MHCIHCGRPILREPAATVNTRNGALHWGPKCAAKAGLTAAAAKRNAAATKRPSRARDTSRQTDWIDNLKTTPTDGKE